MNSKNSKNTKHFLDCPLCKKTGKRDLDAEAYLCLQDTEYHVLGCKSCKIRWMEIQPDNAELNKLYSDNYFESDTTGYSYSKELTSTNTCFMENAKYFHSLLPTNSKILDIGCATGEFLLALQEMGLTGMGVELSEYAYNIVKERQLSVLRGDIFTEVLDNMKFDGIHMSHVLEHLPDINKALARTSDLLRDQGVVYIEVPYQFDSFLDIANQLTNRHKPQFGPFSIHHLHFFTVQSIRLLLQKHGFKIIHLKTYRPCRRQGVPTSLKKILLGGFLYLSDTLFKKGDVISLWARKDI